MKIFMKTPRLPRPDDASTVGCIALAARLRLASVHGRRRQMAILVALVVSVCFDAAWARPLRRAEELRAAVCCATRCAHLRSAVCDSGCCPTAKSPDGSVLSPAGKHQPLIPSLVAQDVPSVLGAAVDSTGHVIAFAPAGDDPPPIFLLTRTLRL